MSGEENIFEKGTETEMVNAPQKGKREAKIDEKLSSVLLLTS